MKFKNDAQKKAVGASYSSTQPFTKENVSKVPDTTGIYKFYDKNGKCIYVGRSKNGKHSGLKHRLQSYYQKDDFKEHPTKTWRGRIKKFSYKKTGVSTAKNEEKKLKQNTRFNADNKNHHLHR